MPTSKATAKPFRNLNGQMIANISIPRPGVTELTRRHARLQTYQRTRGRERDLVTLLVLALRFNALTIPAPAWSMKWNGARSIGMPNAGLSQLPR